MNDAKSTSILMRSVCILVDDNGGKFCNETRYHDMIGSRFYFTPNRPNILFSVYKCVRFQSALKESHRIAVERIIRYLIRIVSYDYGILSLMILSKKIFKMQTMQVKKVIEKVQVTLVNFGKTLSSYRL